MHATQMFSEFVYLWSLRYGRVNAFSILRKLKYKKQVIHFKNVMVYCMKNLLEKYHDFLHLMKMHAQSTEQSLKKVENHSIGSSLTSNVIFGQERKEFGWLDATQTWDDWGLIHNLKKINHPLFQVRFPTSIKAYWLYQICNFTLYEPPSII